MRIRFNKGDMIIEPETEFEEDFLVSQKLETAFIYSSGISTGENPVLILRGKILNQEHRQYDIIQTPKSNGIGEDE